jgi:hypothetical protein
MERRRRMKNLTYLELYKREPKIARLLLINHYFKTHSITKTAKNTVRKALRRYIERRRGSTQ